MLGQPRFWSHGHPSAPALAGRMSASLAPTLIPNPVAIWHGAIENLSPHASPCRYLAPAKWATIRENAIGFCDRFGAEARSPSSLPDAVLTRERA